jgi:hypothetical protein
VIDEGFTDKQIVTQHVRCSVTTMLTAAPSATSLSAAFQLTILLGFIHIRLVPIIIVLTASPLQLSCVRVVIQ